MAPDVAIINQRKPEKFREASRSFIDCYEKAALTTAEKKEMSVQTAADM